MDDMDVYVLWLSGPKIRDVLQFQHIHENGATIVPPTKSNEQVHLIRLSNMVGWFNGHVAGNPDFVMGKLGRPIENQWEKPEDLAFTPHISLSRHRNVGCGTERSW